MLSAPFLPLQATWMNYVNATGSSVYFIAICVVVFVALAWFVARHPKPARLFPPFLASAMLPALIGLWGSARGFQKAFWAGTSSNYDGIWRHNAIEALNPLLVGSALSTTMLLIAVSLCVFGWSRRSEALSE